MERLKETFARPKKYLKWLGTPVWRAFCLALFLSVILVPYWWLIVQWSSLYFADPGLRFTFTTTTFLLVLIIADSTFLIRYYQIVRGSEYEQMVQELRLAEEAVRLANRKLNLLAGITRHDINNQLFSLKAFLELSKESLGDAAKTGEYIRKEEQAAAAIERQIVFTQEYEDLGVKSPLWQNLETCIRNTTTALPMRGVSVLDEVRGREVFADPMFERVFYNLIDNALRYGGEKMTIIRIIAQESEKGLVISVEDDGPGISAEDRGRLFERGFGKNTGLGLFLSREILSITGITITENGKPGTGARFEILVPKGRYRFSLAADTRPLSG
jgi:signal transduction histidine kinase